LPPNRSNPPVGCAFKPRNTLGNADLCLTDRRPQLADQGNAHFVQDCPGCLAK
jgi:oligopeptide transport system ATP-binding protein